MTKNIIYRIPAVRSREQYAIALCDAIEEPRSSIFWDEDRKGSVWNKFRIWNLYKEFPEVTHICMLDDDAEVVHGFKDFVEVAVSNFPDCILSFCHCNANPVRMKEKAPHTPYMLLRNFDFRGISLCVPVQYINGYLDFVHERLPDYKRDDTSLKMYACMQNIPCILTVPNLVRAREIPSAIHPRFMSKNSDTWQGFDVDINQFKTSEYSVRKSNRLFDFHLKPDVPIVQEVAAIYKKRLLMEDLMNGNN